MVVSGEKRDVVMNESMMDAWIDQHQVSEMTSSNV